MEYEASLLAGGSLIALSAESYGTCARATSRLHDTLLNSGSYRCMVTLTHGVTILKSVI